MNDEFAKVETMISHIHKLVAVNDIKHEYRAAKTLLFDIEARLDNYDEIINNNMHQHNAEIIDDVTYNKYMTDIAELEKTIRDPSIDIDIVMSSYTTLKLKQLACRAYLDKQIITITEIA